MNNNAYENEQNTQALLFPCKIYRFGASGTDLLIPRPCTSRRDFKGSVFRLIKQSRVNSGSRYLKCFLVYLCNISKGFGILLSKLPLKRKPPSLFSRNIWTIYVFQPLSIVIYHIRCFVLRNFLKN